MDQHAKFETIDDGDLQAIQGGYLLDNRVVIVGCTRPYPPLGPGQVTWNPWIGQPYPTTL